jgi:chaperone required for assembly of F1-ATPase
MSGADEGKREAPTPADRPSIRVPTAERAGTRRFYRAATFTAEPVGTWILRLDDRPARTPAKRPLALPTSALAARVAAEWQAQGEWLDPLAMPLTRIVNSIIDGVAERADEVRADIVRYAESDLLCYRAEGPAGLVERQKDHWDPVLAWLARDVGATLLTVRGVTHVAQPAASSAAIARILQPLDPFRLGAAHVVTTATGSAVLALALLSKHLDAAAVCLAGEIDERWQAEQWGVDEEAETRRLRRAREIEAAGTILATLDA